MDGFYDGGVANPDKVLKGRIGFKALNSNDVTITCNGYDNLQKGMIFLQSCELGTEIKGNIFNRLNLGLVTGDEYSGNYGLIGDQGSPGNSPGNKYQGVNNTGDFVEDNQNYAKTKAGSFRFNHPTQFFSILGCSTNTTGPDVYYTPVINSSLNGPAFGIVAFSSPFSCSPCVGTSISTSQQIGYLVRIARDTLSSEDGAKNTSVYSKVALLMFLDDNLNYLDSSTVLDSFYTASGSDNIGAMLAIKKKMTELSDRNIMSSKTTFDSKVDEASAETNNLNIVDLYSINQKDYNKLLFKFLKSGPGSFNAADSSDLADIANQCLYTGGFAVIQARELYNFIERFKYYDEAALCAGGGSPRIGRNTDDNESKPHALSATVYPNPNGGSFSIIINQKTENGVIKITDITEREVFKQRLSAQQFTTSFNLNVTPGSYFYKFIAEGKTIKNGKMVIVK